ncbi:hypothetical protein [Mesorhizobium sp. M7A.F.Ce.TU.012.03.2.1]|uniref:hypothetical protein n=1 Tax=Mesorhizobium sp. M7A.F.Ce.TU.012.03.2.1 TaxID=2493681 RepID=UPI000FD79400|nr:hypothetical protein [Mesorhizobium sp. M7A.F.Ce.TU.012.03.2.1]AZV21580.1 hypothetical protein EJ079_22340 [Mesorhizobium sp. M7A.F.Ce.TU.012.03.2.1]
MFKLFSAIFSVVFVATANAQSFENIENCRQLLGNADRLACYDALKPDEPLPLKTEPAASVPDPLVKLALARFNVQEENVRQRIYSSRIELHLSFSNASAKRVSALALLITIRDAFGDEILVNDSKLDINIQPGGSTASNTFFFWEDNQFIHDDAYSKLIGPVTAGTAKTEVTVKRIVYQDGTLDTY